MGALRASFAIRFDRGFWGRLLGGIIVAAVFLLVTGVIILPIAYLGLFASKSSYTNEILTQLFVTFGIYGLAWACLRPRLQWRNPP